MEINLQFKEKESQFSYLIKVRAESGFFSKYLDLLEIAFLNCVTNKSIYKKENFFLHLKPYKGNPRVYRSAAKIFIRFKGKKFLFSTPSGSFIRGDFSKGYGEGRILEQDAFKCSLLYKALKYCFLYNFSARVHSAMIESGGRVFLLAGHGGSGKSTLSGLLKKAEGFKVLNDNVCFAASTNRNSYVFSLTPDKIGQYDFTQPQPCSFLFFIELHKKQKSEIFPISKKEAFKKIIFLSEFPGYENNAQRERRIENLKKLVSQSKCFSLINGKGLLKNPDNLKSLLSPALI